eukprot:38417_1
MTACLQVLLLSLCWVLIICHSKEDGSSCDSNTILKGDLKCNENDALYRTVLFKGNDPLRVYNLSITECGKNGIYLKLTDTWKNAVYVNHITTEYHTAYHIATSRQFIKLLEAALNENEQDIFLKVDDITNENDIITTMHLIGSKKELWDIDAVTIRFHYKLLSFHEYVNKFEALSLRSMQLENQNNQLKKEVNELNDKYESLSLHTVQLEQQLNTLKLIKVTCNGKGSCDAICPSNYVVLSGGCGAAPGVHFIATRNENGMHCTGHMSKAKLGLGSGYIPMPTTGWAFCMNELVINNEYE